MNFSISQLSSVELSKSFLFSVNDTRIIKSSTEENVEKRIFFFLMPINEASSGGVESNAIVEEKSAIVRREREGERAMHPSLFSHSGTESTAAAAQTRTEERRDNSKRKKKKKRRQRTTCRVICNNGLI